jgi:hypothetical protein
MKHLYLFVTAMCIYCTNAFSQFSKHIVQFTDKKGTAYNLNQPASFLSKRAIDRRNRYKINIDSTDLPVSAVYLDSIRKVPNVSIHNISKWLNQVCIVTTDAAALAKINSFLFVKKTQPIAARVNAGNDQEPVLSKKFSDYTVTELTTSPAVISDVNGTNNLNGVQNNINYGANAKQINIHEGEFLHNKALLGQDMVIAVLDGGFNNYDKNIAFDSIRNQNQILGQWDFVKNEASTIEDDAHGSLCLSVMAANRPGIIVGTAPKAKFWLFRTEDVASEYPIEEQNWAAAAEFSDSAGVDIISSSLGYSDFTNPAFNYTHAQRNGNTAISTLAADLAARKGILVCNSAGNSGTATSELKYVICPADADSVLCVGATDPNGVIASFSSWGPNGAGKTKPNVVSVGAKVIIASSVSGNPATSNGTSFSNPNMCGLAACLWQAFPEFNNVEIISALQRSAHKFESPDDRYGYGIPNMRKAYEILAAEKIIRNYNSVLVNNWIKAFPVPYKDKLFIFLKAPTTGRASVRLLDIAGRTIETKVVEISEASYYTLAFDKQGSLPGGVYSVQYTDGKNNNTLRIVKQ